MLQGLLCAFGRIAKPVAVSRALGLGQGRGQMRGAGDGRHGRQGNNVSAELSRLTDNRLSGAVLAGAVETGRAMMNRPGVRASLEAAVLGLLGGSGEQFQSVEAARESADGIALNLQEARIVPNRLGVDGLPGSGKSTLARVLADKLCIKWISLDHENMDVPRDFAPERTVYEHQRLFRTQDVDVFDVIIYVDEPVGLSKARVLQRARTEARGSIIIDVLDFDKLKEIGKLAFDVCEGETVSIPGSSLLVKVRPPGGFRAIENIVSRLRAAGHDAEGMGKEEMLFLLACGRPRSGLKAYFLPGAYNEELLRGLLMGIQRYWSEP